MIFEYFYISLQNYAKPIQILNRNIPAVLVFLLFMRSGIFAETQAQLDDGIDVIIESSPYSIKFNLNDTIKYELQNVSCKTVNTFEQPGNDEHICEDLYPCSTYLATLTILNLADQQVIEKTIDANTTYIESKVEITGVYASVEKINITWTATDRTCIDVFYIKVKSIDKEFTGSINNDKSEQLIDGLNACQEHNIQLKTYNIRKELISNLTRTTTTLYAEPEKISVTIEQTENAQIRISWDQQKYRTCIYQYHLKWIRVDCPIPENGNLSILAGNNDLENSQSNEIVQPDEPDNDTENSCESSVNLTDPNIREYTINELQGCELYSFEMYINENKTSKCEPTNFTSPEEAPGMVTPKSPEISSTNITLYWTAPSTNSKCVHYYRVYVVGPIQRDTEMQTILDTATEDTEAFFNELDPCGLYNFTITAVSHNGTAGGIMYSSFETLEAKPTPIRNVIALTGPHDVNITWDPPAFGDLCLSGYRVSGWKYENNPDENFDKTTTLTSIQIVGLFSCQSYTAQIIPTTTNMDGELTHIEFETAAVTALAPNNFQVIGLYPNAFELSAQDSDLNNNCEAFFARFVCELSKNADVLYKTAEQYVEGQLGGLLFKAFIAPLSPFSEYKCSVALFNVAGWSLNRTIIKKTEPYFPDPPTQVNLKANTNVTLNFIWKQPKYANGNIKLYILNFHLVEPAYYIPPSCNKISVDYSPRETSSLELSFDALLPFTKYSIQVAAQNEYGIGAYSIPYIVSTKPWVSEPVLYLKVTPEGPYDSYVEYKANVIVSWMLPCKSNGEIESFELQFFGEHINYEREYFNRTVMPFFDASGMVVYNETNLKPEYNYTVNVVVKTAKVNTVSQKANGKFEAPAGIPKKLSDATLRQTRVNAYEASNPTTSAVVRFPADILDSESGQIIYVALLLSEKECNPPPQMSYGPMHTEQDWPDTLSWREVVENGSACLAQYQTTPLRWKPTISTLKSTKIEDASKVEYIIGTDKCDNALMERYCNSQLKADTQYYLVIRLFTRSGYNDAALLEFKTDSVINLSLILISVSSCLLLAFLAGFIYLWVTKRIIWHRESCHGIEDSFGDIAAKNFGIYYREISKPEKIAREFKELTIVAMDLSYSASELGCNKNRYADIFPYDKNRVILDIDAEGSDYINASFIDGYRRKKEYIATQGPKVESTLDFWRMVLQHNVRLIVMTTQFREGEVVKCHEYFPFKSKVINVNVKRKDVFDLYDRTEMCVTHDKYGLKQRVVHFYFKKWPDHGCPADPNHLITFIRKVKAERLPNYSPIVVHCSAGVGRTGTFIALDIIMQRIKSEAKVNIYETVKKLRFQRMKMVQTLAQYTFLYACTYELVKTKKKYAALKCKNKTTKKVTFEDDNNGAKLHVTTASDKCLEQNDSDLFLMDKQVLHSEKLGTINYDVKPIKFKATSSNGAINTKALDVEVVTTKNEMNISESAM